MSMLNGQVQGRCPVRWLDHRRQAIAELPEHVDLSAAGPIREQLLCLINRGAQTLIVDMSATVSCDHAGTETLARVYRRAAASGTELRLIVTAPVVRRVLAISGLDRLVSVYPTVDAALAAGRPAVVVPLVPRAGRTGAAGAAVPEVAGAVIKLPAAGVPDSKAPAITPAVAWQALDVLPDAVALVDGFGDIRLANRCLEEMFGYPRADLPGRSLRMLFPASFEMPASALDAAARTPGTSPPASGAARLTGTRRDGSTFPVQVIFRPVPARTGRLTLAVIRDGTEAAQRDRPAAVLDPAASALAARQQHLEETLHGIASSIFEVGIVLSAAPGMPADSPENRIDEAVQLLDDLIRKIYDAALRDRPSTPVTVTSAWPCHVVSRLP